MITLKRNKALKMVELSLLFALFNVKSSTVNPDLQYNSLIQLKQF